MWETGPRTRVPQYLAAENLHLFNKLKTEFGKKMKADKEYIKALKDFEEKGDSKKDALDKALDSYYHKNLLLFSGSHRRLISLMMLFSLSTYSCFSQKAVLKPNTHPFCLDLPEYPGPASNVIIELLRKDDKYYIRALYNGKAFKICPGRYYCEIGEFYRTIDKKINLNYYTTCANEKRSMVVINRETLSVLKRTKWNQYLTGLLLAQILVIFWVCCCCRKKRAERLIHKEIQKKMKNSDRWSLRVEDEK